MTADLRTQLPQLYSQEEVDDPKAIAKFFTPDSNWTWYATEFDGKDTFFGLVDGFEKELGYFSLKELESIRGAFGLPIERDLWFEPTPLSEISWQKPLAGGVAGPARGLRLGLSNPTAASYLLWVYLVPARVFPITVYKTQTLAGPIA